MKRSDDARDFRPTGVSIGQRVPGFDIPVINERAVRAAAGILFLLGAIAWGLAWQLGSLRTLQPFGVLFMAEMMVRITAGDRWSPTLALGRVIVSRQRPEWVGASQKLYAWTLGFSLAVISCAVMGFVTAPLWVPLALCALCLSFLFVETAFGICVGCSLQKLFTGAGPQYCAGDTCAVYKPSHSSTFSSFSSPKETHEKHS